MRINKKIAGGVAAGAVLLAGGGAAWAYWSTSGSGTGSASVGTSSAFAITSDAATGGALSPNGATDTIAYHVANANAGSQFLGTVTISVANSGGAAWSSGKCSASDFSVDGATAGTAATQTKNVDIAGGATKDYSVSLKMVDTGVNQDDCKGVTVPLYFSSN